MLNRPLETLAVLALALAFDQFWGEPPTPLHPVVWMGKFIGLLERISPKSGSNRQLLYGLITVLGSVGLLLFATNLSLNWVRSWSWTGALLLEAILFKCCFSLRMLQEVAVKMRDLLASKQIEAARLEMKSLVSRDVSRLTDEQMTAATIESVAENTTDSFVAPFLFYLFFGVPGVLAYRLVNTFDSMIGYRGKYEYLGKAAARLDDILNYIPARLTAFLLIFGAPWYRGDRANAFRITRRDASKTASPNAGWTMAAMAGALRVQLIKINHYKLGDDEGLIVPSLINRAVAAMYIVAAECVGLALVLAGLVFLIF